MKKKTKILDKNNNFFKNIILNPKKEDIRNYEDYEETVTYEWISDLEGIVDLEEGKTYECNGSYAQDKTLAALVYGYANDLNNTEIDKHILSNRVNMHQHRGFQIISTISDKRIFEAGDTENLWLDSFIRYIANIWDGFKHDGEGNIEKDNHGLAKLNYVYDYIWIMIPKDEEIMFKSVRDKWEKINIDNNIGYIKWINQ